MLLDGPLADDSSLLVGPQFALKMQKCGVLSSLEFARSIPRDITGEHHAKESRVFDRKVHISHPHTDNTFTRIDDSLSSASSNSP